MAKRLLRGDIASYLKVARWAATDLVDEAAPLKNPPTLDTLRSLSKLAGLNEPDPKVLSSLHSQLRFVETLQEVETANVSPVVRLVAPHPVPLSLRGPSEESIAWDATASAHDSVGGYYVVKAELVRGES